MSEKTALNCYHDNSTYLLHFEYAVIVNWEKRKWALEVFSILTVTDMT